jgi:hypothetical protein
MFKKLSSAREMLANFNFFFKMIKTSVKNKNISIDFREYSGSVGGNVVAQWEGMW